MTTDAFPKGSRGFRLLTPGNPKTEKGRGAGYWTFILHLAPASLSGHNVCAMATAGCKAACLNTAGRGGIMAGHGILTAADVAAGLSTRSRKPAFVRLRPSLRPVTRSWLWLPTSQGD
jgi:hypothetical protein